MKGSIKFFVFLLIGFLCFNLVSGEGTYYCDGQETYPGDKGIGKCNDSGINCYDINGVRDVWTFPNDIFYGKYFAFSTNAICDENNQVKFNEDICEIKTKRHSETVFLYGNNIFDSGGYTGKQVSPSKCKACKGVGVYSRKDLVNTNNQTENRIEWKERGLNVCITPEFKDNHRDWNTYSNVSLEVYTNERTPQYACDETGCYQCSLGVHAGYYDNVEVIPEGPVINPHPKNPNVWYGDSFGGWTQSLDTVVTGYPTSSTSWRISSWHGACNPNLCFDPLCPGDANGDGLVNMLDIDLLLKGWMREGCRTGNDCCENSDINADGVVDLNDFATLADNWLEDCNGGTEPPRR